MAAAATSQGEGKSSTPVRKGLGDRVGSTTVILNGLGQVISLQSPVSSPVKGETWTLWLLRGLFSLLPCLILP